MRGLKCSTTDNPQVLTPLASSVALFQRRFGHPLSDGSSLASHLTFTSGHMNITSATEKWVQQTQNGSLTTQRWLQLGRPCNPPRYLQEVCFWPLCLHVGRSFGYIHWDKKDLRLKNWRIRCISHIKPWSLPGYTCRQRQKPSCNWEKAFDVPFH